MDQLDLESTQQQLDDLGARIREAQAKIAALQEEAAKARRRVDLAEGRADAVRRRMGMLEARARETIRALQAEALVHREDTENLQAALKTSRTIGAAIGIIMAAYAVDEPGGFAILRKASQDGNRKLAALAEEIVFTGGAVGLPSGPQRPIPQQAAGQPRQQVDGAPITVS